MSLAQQSVTALRALLVKGEIKPSEILDDLFAEISTREQEIGAFLSLDRDAIRQAADAADLSLPLGGVPIAMKDNINVKGEPCTCGSQFLAEKYRSPYDAGVTRRLREAGAVFFGRTNMDEFAMGSATENSALQKTQNPAAPGHIPGGSSGGSAAAVAANWLDSPTRIALRHRRHEAILWSCLTLWSGGVCFLARSDRADDS
jgi:aspartyl-tRNA(Asn)/glutamyl-tRNA(Gln) amidotransferase subunit A